MRKSHAVLVALLLVVMGAVPASATRGQPDHPVPIRGALVSVDNTPDFQATDCAEGTDWQWRYGGFGSGTASHLGKVSFEYTHCTIAVFGPIKEGVLTVTAANGDTLVLAYEGDIVFVGGQGAEPFVFEFTWAVDSGTGRFDGATGSGDGIGVTHVPADPTADPVITNLTLTGDIAYDASNRANR